MAKITIFITDEQRELDKLLRTGRRVAATIG